MRLDCTERLDVDRALLADPGQVVADEVDDHDVLGVVLREQPV
jgi:hypothetical protein